MCVHGGKRRFDRISRPNMSPVLGRKIVKCQQLCRLGILRFIGSDEEGKRHLGPLAVECHLDGLEPPFGLRLEVLGQLV